MERKEKSIPTKYLVLAIIIAVLIVAAIVCYIMAHNQRSTSYSIEELKSMALEINNYALDNKEDDDYSKEALKTYNIMLGYVEDTVGKDYNLFDFYYVPNYGSWGDSYVIKIVLGDYLDGFEYDRSVSTTDDRVVAITYDKKNGQIDSQIEPFLMARKWTNDLTGEITEKYPQYHVNARFISLDNIVPNVKKEKYKSIDDYTHFYNDDFYTSREMRGASNIINIIVPPGTNEEEAQKIFDDLQPILKKYCVTVVAIYAPINDEAMQQIIENEKITNNSYSTSFDDLAWEEVFKLTQN